MHRVPFGRLIPGALLSLMLMLPSFARSQEALPESIVLVLNVLSDTHARPATGVVVSASGQVLVPASFVGRGDRIVVLSGGNSLESDAVETRTEFRSLEAGIAVLAAAGLERAPIVLTEDAPGTGQRLDFIAFPPAEQLAEGAPPVRRTTSALYEDGTATLSTNPPLPGVNGVLIDRCGQLAGLALIPENTGARPGHRIVWARDLRNSLEASDLQSEFRRCGAGAGQITGADETTTHTASSGTQILDSNSLQPKAPDLALSSDLRSPPRSEPLQQQPENPDFAVSPEASEPDPAMASSDDPPTVYRPDDTSAQGNAGHGATATGLQWMVLVPMFILAAAAGWWVGRGSRRTPQPGPDEPAEPAKMTPETAAPGETTDTSVDLLLGFNATSADGASRKLGCRLRAKHGQALVGRGQVDLVIPDASLARVHGRIQVVDDMLLYSDTGSDSGSWVNGISCLEGERFELKPGATLILGGVQLILESIQADGCEDR